jgi:hypothetical protein
MLQATLALYQKSWTLNGTLAAITDPVAFRAVDVTADEYWVDAEEPSSSSSSA